MSESRELAAHEPASLDISQPRASSISPADRLALMREAMTNPNLNPANAREMMLLIKEMEADDRQAEFNRAKGLALAAMPAIYKRGKSDKHQYAKFEDMHRAATPILRANNLTLDFRVGSEGNLITVQPILRHDNGYVEEGAVMKGPADTGPGRSQIQSLGSASAYLKRYVMKGILNLIEDGEDNDGVGVGRPDYQLNDRQEGLIVDAQAQFDLGQYVEWYGRLSTRDKAFLVAAGYHARFGGAPALPGSSSGSGAPADQDARERPAAPPPPPPPPPPAKKEGHDTSTPKGWTDDYIEQCQGAATMAELENVRRKGGKGLDKLNNGGLTDLYDRCDAAFEEARERIASASGGLFGDAD